MHRLNELAAKLTPAHVREVEDFAEFLLTRQLPDVTIVRDGQEFLNPAAVEAAAGMLAGLPADKTAVDLQHEVLTARADED